MMVDFEPEAYKQQLSAGWAPTDQQFIDIYKRKLQELSSQAVAPVGGEVSYEGGGGYTGGEEIAPAEGGEEFPPPGGTLTDITWGGQKGAPKYTWKYKSPEMLTEEERDAASADAVRRRDSFQSSNDWLAQLSRENYPYLLGRDRWNDIVSMAGKREGAGLKELLVGKGKAYKEQPERQKRRESSLLSDIQRWVKEKKDETFLRGRAEDWAKTKGVRRLDFWGAVKKAGGLVPPTISKVATKPQPKPAQKTSPEESMARRFKQGNFKGRRNWAQQLRSEGFSEGAISRAGQILDRWGQ